NPSSSSRGGTAQASGGAHSAAASRSGVVHVSSCGTSVPRRPAKNRVIRRGRFPGSGCAHTDTGSSSNDRASISASAGSSSGAARRSTGGTVLCPAMRLTDEVRANAERVAASARSVSVDLDALGTLEPGPPPAMDAERHYLEGPEADVASYLLVLDTINFGSGWFP